MDGALLVALGLLVSAVSYLIIGLIEDWRRDAAVTPEDGTDPLAQAE